MDWTIDLLPQEPEPSLPEYRDEFERAQEEALAEPQDSESETEEETLVALVRSAGYGVVDTVCGRGLTLQRHEELLKGPQGQRSGASTSPLQAWTRCIGHFVQDGTDSHFSGRGQAVAQDARGEGISTTADLETVSESINGSRHGSTSR